MNITGSMQNKKKHPRLSRGVSCQQDSAGYSIIKYGVPRILRRILRVFSINIEFPMIFNSVDFQGWMSWLFGQETELFIEFFFDCLGQEAIVFPKCFSQDNFYVNHSAIPGRYQSLSRRNGRIYRPPSPHQTYVFVSELPETQNKRIVPILPE